jgi:ABC-type sugar transport system ATPase subunit
VDPAPVEAQVDVLERMGNETFLHLKHGDTPLLARVDPHTTAEPDQTVQVVFDASELYAFDPATDASIPLGMQP